MLRSMLPACLALTLVACGAGHQDDREASARKPSTPASRPAAPASAALAGTPQPREHFASDTYGFAIDYPAPLHATGDFHRSYFGNADWQAYARPDSHGEPVVALVLPGSNRITAGELRIGVSRDADAVAACTKLPQAARIGSQARASLGGVEFTSFQAGDAGMNHYMETRSYRTVHDGACYAIDLLVTGTNPQVYDPPATPPFAKAEAFKQLQRALMGFRFTR